MLEAYVLLHAPDAGIAQDYDRYRAQNRDKLQAYVESMILCSARPAAPDAPESLSPSRELGISRRIPIHRERDVPLVQAIEICHVPQRAIEMLLQIPGQLRNVAGARHSHLLSIASRPETEPRELRPRRLRESIDRRAIGIRRPQVGAEPVRPHTRESVNWNVTRFDVRTRANVPPAVFSASPTPAASPAPGLSP